MIATPCRLAIGSSGPAVIEEIEATTVVTAGLRGAVDDELNLVLGAAAA